MLQQNKEETDDQNMEFFYYEDAGCAIALTDNTIVSYLSDKDYEDDFIVICINGICIEELDYWIA